jgi:hypothetical protein
MFHILPFQAAHLAQIKLQSSQAYLSEWVTVEQAAALAQHPSYTALDGDTVLGAGGAIPMWENRAMVWSFLSVTGVHNFFKIHRAVEQFLLSVTARRLELTVDCHVSAAHRWARLLGFQMECERMRAYAPDGHDCALYARVS